MKKKFVLILLSYVLSFILLTGCGKKEEEVRKDIEFTVCDRTKLPEELLEIIEEKKHNVFKLSYINNDYMYIVVGYGEKNRQNLNVVVENLYRTDNAIYIETNLITEEEKDKDQPSGGASMYPYIVLKCEKYDLPVVFDID